MKKYKKNLLPALVVICACLAVFIRVYRFGSVPGGMNQDGAMAAVDAKALADYGTDRFGMRYPVHLTAWGFGQMSALLSYLMVPAIRLFGLNAFAARLPMLLVSLAAMVLLYLFAGDAFGVRCALCVLFIAAVNPWHIIQSRWALDCNLFPHFLLAGVFFLHRGVNGKKGMLPVSMMLFGFSMYCYGISLYTVPLLLLSSCLMLLKRKQISLRQAVFCAAVYLVVAWPFLCCMALNTFRLPTIETPLITIPFFPQSVRSRDILFFSDAPLRQLGQNARSLLLILLQAYNGAACNEVRGFGSLYSFSLPFTALGMVICFRRFRRNTGAALTALWFCVALFAGLVTANVNINRINIIFYPLILFNGIGLYAVLRFCLQKKSLRWFAAVLPAVWITAFSLFVHAYFTTYADLIADVFMADFGNAVTAIRGTDAEKIYISADAQYPGYSHVSEILTLFYLDIDAKDYQSHSFHERFTFRIPPDPDPFENAVYVAARSDLPLFPPEKYDASDFGKFLVITQKG